MSSNHNKAGPNSVPAYQLSAIPYITGSTGNAETITGKEFSFPYVTRFITLSNTGNASDEQLVLTMTSNAVTVAPGSAVKSLNKGDKAPFSGTLMNQQAVGEFLVKLNASEKICQARIEKEVNLQRTNCSLAVDKLKIANDFQISVYQSQNDFLKSQIDLSVKQLKKKNAAPEWWFVGGFALGALATIASGYLINKASD